MSRREPGAAGAGLGVKDSVTFDPRTGLVLERSFLKHQDSRHGVRVRFGQARWLVALDSFHPAEKPKPPKVAPAAR